MTSHGGLVLSRELDASNRVVLDMDSTESPVQGSRRAVPTTGTLDQAATTRYLCSTRESRDATPVWSDAPAILGRSPCQQGDAHRVPQSCWGKMHCQPLCHSHSRRVLMKGLCGSILERRSLGCSDLTVSTRITGFCKLTVRTA